MTNVLISCPIHTDSTFLKEGLLAIKVRAIAFLDLLHFISMIYITISQNTSLLVDCITVTVIFNNKMHSNVQPQQFPTPQQLQSLFNHNAPTPTVDQMQRDLFQLSETAEYLTSLNKELKIQYEYATKEISFLHEKIKELEAENRRLYTRLNDHGEGISTRRSNRDLEGIMEEVKELGQLLERTKRESEEKISSLSHKNDILRESVDALTSEGLKMTSRHEELEIEISQLRETLKLKMEEIAGLKFVLQTNRFKKKEGRPEETLSGAPSVAEMSKKTSLSSIDILNSSMDSTMREEVFQQLKQQNSLLRSQLIDNNRRFQSQIEKLNEYIDKLLSKQAQMEPLKLTLSTLFNALTVSFIIQDFGNEKTLYEKKILQLLDELKREQMRGEGMQREVKELKQQIETLELAKRLRN